MLLKGAPCTVDRDDRSIFRIQTADRCYVIKGVSPEEAAEWVADIGYYN